MRTREAAICGSGSGGQEQRQRLGFDNMQDRAVKGTSDWQEASVVLDVLLRLIRKNIRRVLEGDRA
jgi:hypothetical protein